MLEDEKDKTWLACFLDTDGTVFLTKWSNKNGTKHSRIWLAFYNKNKQILEKVDSLIPGNIYFHGRNGVDNRGIKRGHNYTFCVSTANNISKQVLELILPYLIVKKAKAIKCLSNLIN